MQIYLHPELEKYFSATFPLFDQLMALPGECFRQQQGRITQRVALGDKYYFIKKHLGVGWKEIIKNILQLRLPVISAKQEERAIQRLQSLGIATPTVVGCGVRGINPAKRQSFVLLEELPPAVSLETLCQSWQHTPPPFAFKRKLIAEVARIARIVHTNGVNHRDFYICHFLLARESLSVYLIDLHRAQIRSRTPERWIIKDLAGLYFSSKNIGLTRRDLYRFIRFYRQKSLRDILHSEKLFWQKVQTRGEKLYFKESSRI